MATAKAKRHRQTAGQTDDGQSDPYVALCFTGAQKLEVSQFHSVGMNVLFAIKPFTVRCLFKRILNTEQCSENTLFSLQNILL